MESKYFAALDELEKAANHKLRKECGEYWKMLHLDEIENRKSAERMYDTWIVY